MTDAPIAPANLPVDVFGPIDGRTGWSRHGVGFSRALNALVPVSARTGRRALRAGLLGRDRGMCWRGLFAGRGRFGVVVVGTAFPDQPSARWIFWETTRLPDAVSQQCQTTSFVWTPSSWGRQMLIENGLQPNRVQLVPCAVDSDFFRPAPPSPEPRPFRFLFVGKWETRKFVDGLVQAFRDEFAGQTDVELVLHAHNPYARNFSVAGALAVLGAAGDSRILVSGPTSDRGLRRLYQSADVFVCPTRGEGWGLPILEAMSCGVPAIVTRYSAPLEFVSDRVGYLLDVRRMVDAHCDMFNIHTGQWAEPDVDHLRVLMRRTFEQRDETTAKGARAREEALRWSWPSAATVALSAIRSALA